MGSLAGDKINFGAGVLPVSQQCPRVVVEHSCERRIDGVSVVRLQQEPRERSYLDFFMGFGWPVSGLLLLQSALLWQMASLARSGAMQVTRAEGPRCTAKTA